MYFVLSALVLHLCVVDEVQADVSWLDKITSCEELALRVHAYALAIQADKPISDEQNAEIDRIFAVACGERFRKCHYAICDDNGVQGTNASIGGEVPQKDLLSDANLNKGVIATDGEAFTRDPLAWLKHDWNCEEFNEQIKLRYSPLGEYRAWPENKKQEMSQILIEACGSRFAHCKYPACPVGGASDKVDKSGVAELGDAKKEKKVKK